MLQTSSPEGYREGAHSVLQIRTSKFSKKWEEDWNKAQSEIYKEAA